MKIDDENIFCDDIATIAANENFGIKYLYPWQRLVVANILDAAREAENPSENETDLISPGRQIVLLPTGAGKSLCFQIPAILLNGPTLVIYPLLALMSDQERRMIDGSLKCVVFRGGQTEEQREEKFRQIENGAKIIIANPEVLANKSLTERLAKCGIKHIAIDEAHCVSEWGDSFRPAYLELGRILKELNCKVITAFTATASPEVLDRVSQVLFDGDAHIVRSDSDRPNIHYYVRKVEAKKQAALLLSRTEQRPMIIFCGTRGHAEDMSRELNAAFGEETSRFYHAGLEKEEKTAIENWFFRQKDAVLCATCAYGMGVDKKDIHTVIHLDPPATAEAYIQEAGRGGRDGSVANAILLWSSEDSRKYSAFPPESRYSVLKKFAETSECRRQVLLDALGAEQAVCSGCDICDSRTITQKPVYGIKKITRKFLSFPAAEYLNVSHTINSRLKAPYLFPGIEAPEDRLVMIKMLKCGQKYFTEETLEQKFLEIMNGAVVSKTKCSIWDHTGFSDCYLSLLKSKTVRKLKWPWKDRLELVKKRSRSCSRLKRLLLYYSIFFRRQILHLHQIYRRRPFFRQILERQEQEHS